MRVNRFTLGMNLLREGWHFGKFARAREDGWFDLTILRWDFTTKDRLLRSDDRGHCLARFGVPKLCGDDPMQDEPDRYQHRGDE